MGLIDDLKRAVESARASNTASSAIEEVRKTLGAAENDGFGKDLANVLELIAERVEGEHVPVPLDADGNPLEQDEEYRKSTDEKFWVVGYGRGCYVAVAKGFDCGLIPPDTLSKGLPDTQERIDADKQKHVYKYWGCDYCGCDDCPAVVDGERPFERFGFGECVTGCEKAMGYELALRQAQLAAPKGVR